MLDALIRGLYEYQQDNLKEISQEMQLKDEILVSGGAVNQALIRPKLNGCMTAAISLRMNFPWKAQWCWERNIFENTAKYLTLILITQRNQKLWRIVDYGYTGKHFKSLIFLHLQKKPNKNGNNCGPASDSIIRCRILYFWRRIKIPPGIIWIGRWYI